MDSRQTSFARGDLIELLELQRVDSEIDRLEQRISNLDEQAVLDELEGKATTAEAVVAAQRAKVEEVERSERRLGGEIQRVEFKLKSEEGKLYGGMVSNPKELSSLQTEVESLKRRRSTLEDELLQILEDSDSENSLLSSLESELASIRRAVEQATRERDAARDAAQEQLDMQRRLRKEIAQRVDEALLERYEEIRPQKGGVGVAALVGGVCQGCHIKLSAQELEAVLASAGLVLCDNCRRILVVLS